MTQQNRSGRGRGRGGSRSGRGGAGRGRGHSSRRGQQPATPKKKKTLSDYKFHVGNVSQGSDFQEIARYLINHIRGHFDQGDDIATALELRRDIDFDHDLPIMVHSQAENDEVRAHENEALLIVYKAEIAQFVQRKTTYKTNKTKAYAFLFKQCGTSLQSKITNRSDYELSIRNNPIKLMDAIQYHSMSYQENRYEMLETENQRICISYVRTS